MIPQMSAVSNAETLELPLRDMSQMFNAPPVDPLSPGLPESLGITGVEYVLQQLEIKRPMKLTTLKLVVPQGKFSPELGSQVEHALRSFAERRIPQLQILIHETRRQGWRLTGVAVLLLAFFLALATLFASEYTEWLRPLIRKTLEYGSEIIGWVMLWYPIEVLVFQPIPIKGRMKALRRLMQLKVLAEPTPLFK